MEEILFEYKKDKDGIWKDIKTGELMPSDIEPSDEADSIIILQEDQPEPINPDCEDCGDEKSKKEVIPKVIPQVDDGDIFWEGMVELPSADQTEEEKEAFVKIIKNPPVGVVNEYMFNKFFYNIKTKDILYWNDGNKKHHRKVWKAALKQFSDPDDYKSILKKGSIRYNKNEDFYTVRIFAGGSGEDEPRESELEVDAFNRLAGPNQKLKRG